MSDIQNYLLDHAGWDWRSLLRHWDWLVPQRFAPWMVNRFGDVIMKLPDGSIHHFDAGNGSVQRVANDREAFCKRCDDPNEANFFFMIPLVDQLARAGRVLEPGQCYSYGVAPAFGGSYTCDNVLIRSVSDHYDILGPMHKLTQNIPDGTPIQFIAEEPDQTKL